jgi:Domain of unknown function (DUF5060)/Protein of unknown function (DUF4038)
MGLRCLPLLFLCATAGLRAQTACPATALYSPCDIVFELNDAEAAAHPNPYLTVDLHAEFRSPRHRTYLMPAFWDGGRRFVIRFSPTEAGDWDYRITANIPRLDGGSGKLSATAIDNPELGFIRAANVHHFAHTDDNKNVPHLWMGDTALNFGFMDAGAFEGMVEAHAKQKFDHIRGAVLVDKMFPQPDRVDPAPFQQFDQRILALNRKGLIADLILAAGRGELTRLFPTWQDRERYVRYIVARYAAMNVTWQIVDAFEEYENGRALMKEVGMLLKNFDPYQHPRSTGALVTSAPLLEDGWMNYITYRSSEDQLGAIEHQLYAAPAVNVDTGPARDADAVRHRLWNVAMNGQYAGFGNAAWFDFFSASRHWDLEPYFDVDGGRALALEDIEYLVYVEKPGPVEIAVEKHSYDVAWFNPISGEFIRQKKDFKGEKFLGEPPDKTHDWVLRLSREGTKESMLKSYRFEARAVTLQEVEQTSAKLPFDLVEPAADTLPAAQPIAYAAKLKRETRATRSMMWLWTGEVASDGQGYRVLATGPKGTLQIPAEIARRFPAVLQLRLTVMNANGKVYAADRIVQLTK